MPNTTTWKYARRATDVDEPLSSSSSSRTFFIFRTDYRYAYDPDTRTFSISRDEEEAFLDVAQAVAMIVDDLDARKSSSDDEVLYTTFEWFAVYSNATKRCFASMLHRALDGWGDDDTVSLRMTVLDIPAAASELWKHVFLVGESWDFSRRFAKKVDAGAALQGYDDATIRDSVTPIATDLSEDTRLRLEFVIPEDRSELDSTALSSSSSSLSRPTLLVLRLPVSQHATARESRRVRKGTATPVSTAPVCVVADDATTEGAATVMGVMHNLSRNDTQTHCEIVGIVPLWSAKRFPSDRREKRMRQVADVLAWTCTRFRPKRVVDFASSFDREADEAKTSSPSVVPRELFDSSFAYYCACDKLAKDMDECCERAGERCLRMPKWKGYARYTSSAEVSSFMEGKTSGYAAAMFISDFVCPRLVRRGWVHVSIDDVGCLDTAVEVVRKCVDAPPPGW